MTAPKSSIEYLANNRLKHTNARGKVTTQSFHSYGNPEQKQLIRVDHPEAITTVIDRNDLQLVTKISPIQAYIAGPER